MSLGAPTGRGYLGSDPGQILQIATKQLRSGVITIKETFAPYPTATSSTPYREEVRRI